MLKEIKIANKIVGENKPVFVIAEAGVNHNGSLRMAKKLVEAAKAAGADAIKFQTFKTEELVTFDAPKAEYQKKTVRSKSQFQMLKELELSDSDFLELFNYCKRKKILFMSTPFDAVSALFLERLGMRVFKISSGELTNVPLLLQIAKFRKPIILSTGMATLQEVKEAVRIIYLAGNNTLILLHCTSNYPTKYENVNLKAINTLKNEFGIPIGYSDHTEGIEVAIAAVAMGAAVIEKHFTLDRRLPGPDHKASLEPEELTKIIRSIRNIERAKGDGKKIPRKSEMEVKRVGRKSLVAARNISKREKLTSAMIKIKRPGTGISPYYFDKVIGYRTERKIDKDHVIRWCDLR